MSIWLLLWEFNHPLFYTGATPSRIPWLPLQHDSRRVVATCRFQGSALLIGLSGMFPTGDMDAFSADVRPSQIHPCEPEFSEFDWTSWQKQMYTYYGTDSNYLCGGNATFVTQSLFPLPSILIPIALCSTSLSCSPTAQSRKLWTAWHHLIGTSLVSARDWFWFQSLSQMALGGL